LHGLLDAALELAQSSWPQDGSTAAYIFRFLIRIPSFTDVLRTHLMAESTPRHSHNDTDDTAVSTDSADTADNTDSSNNANNYADDNADSADIDNGDDSYYLCVSLLLQLLHRQLDVATANLLQASVKLFCL